MEKFGKLSTLLAVAFVTLMIVGVAHAEVSSHTRLVSGYVTLNDSANVYQALYDNTPIEPETITANAVWKPASLFSAGIEYRYAHRMNEDRTSLGNNRIYAMLMMNF